MILGAVAALVAAGSALAIVRPGDLGGEDTVAPAETTSTTAGADLTTTTTVEVTATTLPGAETTTTIAGSGLSVSGPASGGSDGTAETGGESMLGAGLGLLGLGLVLRRAVRVSPSAE